MRNGHKSYPCWTLYNLLSIHLIDAKYCYLVKYHIKHRVLLIETLNLFNSCVLELLSGVHHYFVRVPYFLYVLCIHWNCQKPSILQCRYGLDNIPECEFHLFMFFYHFWLGPLGTGNYVIATLPSWQNFTEAVPGSFIGHEQYLTALCQKI